MNDVLKVFLSLSLSGSILIVALLICKHFLKYKLSRQWQYYIWLVVIVRLIVPYTPEINIMENLFSRVNISESLLQHYEYDSEYYENLQTENSEFKSQLYANHITSSHTDKPLEDIFVLFKNNIWLLWLIVAFIILIHKITVYKSFVRYIKAGQSPVTDIELLDKFSIIKEQQSIKRVIELSVNSLISSPLLIGFFKPCIVIPSLDISENDFKYTIIHELTHYKRLDMFYKWLVQITVCLHWFNPLVYAMARDINNLCEFSCDEAIVSKLDIGNIQVYGRTLLNAMASVGKYKDNIASITLSDNKKILKERLCAIMNFKKKSKLILVVTLVLTMILSAGATVLGAAYTSSKSNAQISYSESRTFYKDGVLYILCEGADDDDIPISGVTEGSIKIVLVRKDSYISIGPFSDYTNFIYDVIKQCNVMIEKEHITQYEFDQIVEAATKIQISINQNNNEYKTYYESKTPYNKEYSKWDIQEKDGGYYYNNERVRILMDLRENNSFVNFNYDKRYGIVDIILKRDTAGSIISVEYIPSDKVDEILSYVDNSKSYYNATEQSDDIISDNSYTKPNIDFNIRSAFVQILSADDYKIAADYDSNVYDVSINKVDNKWIIDIKCKYNYNTSNEPIKLYLPDIEYGDVYFDIESAAVDCSVIKSGNIVSKIVTASTNFVLPNGFNGSFKADVDKGYLELISEDNYKDCSVTVNGFVDVPKKFNSNINTSTYSNGTQSNVININMSEGYGVLK